MLDRLPPSCVHVDAIYVREIRLGAGYDIGTLQRESGWQRAGNGTVSPERIGRARELAIGKDAAEFAAVERRDSNGQRDVDRSLWQRVIDTAFRGHVCLDRGHPLRDEGGGAGRQHRDTGYHRQDSLNGMSHWMPPPPNVVSGTTLRLSCCSCITIVDDPRFEGKAGLHLFRRCSLAGRGVGERSARPINSPCGTSG